MSAIRQPSKVAGEALGLDLHEDYDLDFMEPSAVEDMARTLPEEDKEWAAQDLIDRNPSLKRAFSGGFNSPQFVLAGVANGFPAEDIKFFDDQRGNIPRDHFARVVAAVKKFNALYRKSITGYIPGPANLKKMEDRMASVHSSGARFTPRLSLEGAPETLLSERMATDIDLKARFNHWNAKAFDGQLPDIPVEWMNSRAKGGEARAQAIRNVGGVRGKIQITPKNIRISRYLATNLEKVDGILLHEMVHLQEYAENYDGPTHGAHFLALRHRAAAKAGRDIPISEDLSGWEFAEDAPEKKAVTYVAAVAPAENGKPPIMDLYLAGPFQKLEGEVRKKLSQFYSERHFTFLQVSLPELERFRARRKVDFGVYQIKPELADKLLAEGKPVGHEPATASAAHTSLEGPCPWQDQEGGQTTRAPERRATDLGDEDTALETMGIVPQVTRMEAVVPERRLVQPSLSHKSGAHLTPRN